VELSEVQDLANKGEVVIGVDAAHIVMAMPGDEKYSESWKVDVPRKLWTTGSGHMWANKPVDKSWTATDGKKVKWFHYTGPPCPRPAPKIFLNPPFGNINIAINETLFLISGNTYLYGPKKVKVPTYVQIGYREEMPILVEIRSNRIFYSR